MKKTISFCITCLAVTLFCCKAHADKAIGSWNAYPAYTDITKIEHAGNMVFVLASDGLYSYTISDRSIQTYDKTKTLSDCSIGNIAWCKQEKKLLVMYDNYNIDLLETNGNTTNLSDYYNKSMTVDKTVNNIDMNGQYAYLSTGFGILKIDMRNATIADTYNLGMKVNATTIIDNTLFAATTTGIYKGRLDDNLADKAKWTKSCSKSFTDLMSLNGSLIGTNNGELCTVDPDNDSWKAFYTPWFNKIAKETDRMVLYGRTNTYIIYSPEKRQSIPMMISGIAYSPSDDTYWLTDSDGKLGNGTIDSDGTVNMSLTSIAPDGPKYNFFGFMRFVNGKLYTCGGLGSPERKACIQVYDQNNGWNTFSDDFAATLDYRYNGAISLDVDPKNPEHVIMGSQAGMYEFDDGKLSNIFTIDNSPLQGAKTVKENTKKNYTIVSSVRFDGDGRLWCTNSVAPSVSLFEYNNGKWESHHHKELINNENYSLSNMVGIIFDKHRDLMWFGSNDWRKPALICYQPSTDGIRLYNNFKNQDGTAITAEYVNSVAEDNEGNIWIATAAGPLMLAASTIEAGDDYFTQVKVPRNDGTNYADYLLSGLRISTIAIDGAGRKWFGTQDNGVYLISSDNMTQLEHFNKSNSPLLSDAIESIAIDENTGEVFFGTDKGLCSYMGDASLPADKMTKDDVYAYPNPVRPDYTGLITVKGLTLDADVKIVTVNGTLVAEGRSNGGMFTWDGRDKKGRRVASGVYMVQTATSDGSKGTVCKIAIIN